MTSPSPSVSSAALEHSDIFIIGGGINGCGIARDAAGRGYRVALAEMNDLAQATSSSSTKLIHGGLRYLEHFEFRLVREALIEREILWRNAPHIIWPLRFILPHHKGLRPAWLLRLGLFLYDHLGGRKHLSGTTTVNMRTAESGKPLKPLFKKGFEYSDCWVNDARLVVLNAMDAQEKGATIMTRTRVTNATRANGRWMIELEDMCTGETHTRTADFLVNAAGPWVDRVLDGALGQKEATNVRLVQGSHIVVNKLFDHDKCYIFQNSDERIIFAIPYEEQFTLIGTTDHEFKGNPGDSRITDEEITYLCTAASEYFRDPISPEDVVWTYSGVRPLYNDGASAAQEATRDYVLKEDGDRTNGPLLNIFGGKITTYRRLAESALAIIGGHLGEKGQSWTDNTHLPGGDFGPLAFGSALDTFHAAYPFLDPAHARRLFRVYGTRAYQMLDGIADEAALGQHFGADVFAAEIRYLMRYEWARTSEDVLYRRTKRGLVLSVDERAALEQFMQAEASTP